ncbi:alternate-type signal peptide domain-containing protein [Glaciihabitans sp. UYNi722]|uniref:alternate-type signal peptide domain-containing protein n=1 Tax=Glaciihabitans sp. UYNi722 TaxID=3156344 RepID=UPI0033935D32
MNKLVKGAIAGAAGIALLLGGAGTFALWNSSASVAGGTIVAGNLVVADPGPAGVWTVNGGTTPVTLSSYRVVPGDVLKFTKTVNVTASGDSLVATLGLGTASITPTAAGNAADVALANYLNANAVLAASGASITGTGPYTVTAGASGIVAQPVVVTATITFPKSVTAGAENAAKSGSVSLAGLTVTLTQN